jgi:hypothetical protein
VIVALSPRPAIFIFSRELRSARHLPTTKSYQDVLQAIDAMMHLDRP